MVGRSDGKLFFLTMKMSGFLYENHWGSPTLTLLNVLRVLGVLYVVNMPMDAFLACWALFFFPIYRYVLLLHTRNL